MNSLVSQMERKLQVSKPSRINLRNIWAPLIKNTLNQSQNSELVQEYPDLKRLIKAIQDGFKFDIDAEADRLASIELEKLVLANNRQNTNFQNLEDKYEKTFAHITDGQKRRSKALEGARMERIETFIDRIPSILDPNRVNPNSEEYRRKLAESQEKQRLRMKRIRDNLTDAELSNLISGVDLNKLTQVNKRQRTPSIPDIPMVDRMSVDEITDVTKRRKIRGGAKKTRKTATTKTSKPVTQKAGKPASQSSKKKSGLFWFL